ncbi:hypothetical protein [Nannocystis pusilla]|uniref:hypothetical protein n=1 Tax=Nannocystis pusilla TaxID=889268 RepID=UPI003DA62A6C
MLPPLYGRWISDLLGGPLPEEQAATCSDCVQCQSHVPEGYRFADATKCCTYVPALPNFLVGGGLKAGSLAGRERLLRRMVAQPGSITPHGLDATDDERDRYRDILAAEQFGRDPSLFCPYYLAEAGGLCGVWRNRNGICATWYCKHDRGARGQRFWQALEVLLTAVERELSHWCACTILFEETPPVEGGEAAWSWWAGREGDFFRRCAELVEALGWSEVQALIGPAIETQVGDLLAAHAALAGPLPDSLQLGTIRVSHRGDERSRVVTYLDTDALELPTALLDLLPRFDGRPTGAVLAELRGLGVEVSPALLRMLVDFELLTAAA